MNHKILFCLVLILGSLLYASADCLDSNPGDVEYDCSNDLEDTGHKDENEEQLDDVVDEDYKEAEDYKNHDDHPEPSSTSTTVKPASTEEEEYDYNSEEHDDSNTQQDASHHDVSENTKHTGMRKSSNEDTATTINSHTLIEKNDDHHINLFYDAVKTSLTSGNYTNAYRYVKHPERVECMIAEMRKSKVMDKINKESYAFSHNTQHEVEFEFRNVTTFMYDLEREIQDANFDCTQMGNTRIIIIILVIILAVVLLIAFIRRRYK